MLWAGTKTTTFCNWEDAQNALKLKRKTAVIIVGFHSTTSEAKWDGNRRLALDYIDLLRIQ
jgi:hypothetical protein